jgi:hypothetical protein
MRFTRYPRWEPYEVTPRKLAAARRAVQKQRDRYPLFPELLKQRTAEERLASIADEREIWWREMRDRHAKLWRKARKALRDLPPGPEQQLPVTRKSAAVQAIRSICLASFTSTKRERFVIGM